MKSNPKQGETIEIKGGKFELIHTRQEVEKKYLELAKNIQEDFSDGEAPMIIRILPKSHYASVDLTRALILAHQDFDFETAIILLTDKKDRHPILQDLTKPVEGRHVIILQNIVATGQTIKLVKNLLDTVYDPASTSLFALGYKPDVYELDINIDYIGFPLENNYYIGEGSGKYDFDQALLGLWQKIK